MKIARPAERDHVLDRKVATDAMMPVATQWMVRWEGFGRAPTAHHALTAVPCIYGLAELQPKRLVARKVDRH